MSGLDMALGDVIASRKKEAPKPKPSLKGAKGGGKGGKGSAKAARAPAPYAASTTKATGGRGAAAANGFAGIKVLVGNLAKDITTADVKELFETVGEVWSAKVFGKSGKAEVVFAMHVKALAAVKQFHLRTLDGMPMSVVLASAVVGDRAERGVAAAKFDGACNNCGKAGHKAAECRSAAKGAAGKGAGRDPSFSIVLPAGKAKFDGACNHCGKAGHKALDCRSKAAGTPGADKAAAKFDGACNHCGKAGHKAAECRSKGAGTPAEPKAKREKKEPAAKEAVPSSADLDGDMDAYFAARSAPAAAE